MNGEQQRIFGGGVFFENHKDLDFLVKDVNIHSFQDV